LQTRFKKAGITASEQGEAITNIFGKKAGVGLAVLMDQMDRLKSKYPDIQKGADDFGKAWGETQKTLSQQWDEIKASFDSMLTNLGDRLIPVLSSVAGFLTKNREIITTLAPAIMGVVAAFTAWAAITKIIELASEMNPWMVAIGAIIAITVLLITHWKEVSKIAKEVWHDAAHAVASAWDTVYDDTIGPVVRAFDYIKSFITGSFDSWWRSHGEEVKAVWREVWAVIRAVFVYEWLPIIDIVKLGWSAIEIIFTTGMAVVTDLFKAGWAYTVAVFKVAWDLISGTVKVAVDYIAMIVKVTWDIIVGVFNVFLDLITGHWSKAWTDIKTMFQQVWNAIKEFFGQALSDIKGTFSRAMSAVVSAARGIVSDMYDAGKQIILGLLHGMESMFGNLLHTAESFGHDIANAVGSVFGIHFSEPSEATQMVKAGQNIAMALSKGMLSGRGAVQAAADLLGRSAGIGGGGGYGAAGAGAGGPVTLQLGGGGSGLDALFMTWLRNTVRASGGSPQIFNKKVQFQ
jgi:phage-related protein